MERNGDAVTVSIRRKAFTGRDGRESLIIDGLEFSMPAATFTCMIGPSGCGKTTTLRILMGLDEEFEGSVASARGHRVGVAFQEPRLLPWRTVAENVTLALHGDEHRHARVEDALRDVGLEQLGGRYPSQLSVGQQRRASLARAFAVRPDVLYLDEPFVSLDEATAQRLRGLLVELWRQHPVTILMVTHNIREAVQLADRLVLLTERPARVAGEVEVSLPREARTGPALEAFAAELAARYPGLVTL